VKCVSALKARHFSQHYTRDLDALDLAITGDPDDRFNKIILGCAPGERLELLLRKVVAHQVHISGLVIPFG
jgi:hypothetical protein